MQPSLTQMPLLRVTCVYFVFSHLHADTLHTYPTTHLPYHPAGIKNNTRAAIVKQRESSITIRILPLLPAGIKNNTHAVVVVWRKSHISYSGALQYPAGIIFNTRAAVATLVLS